MRIMRVSDIHLMRSMQCIRISLQLGFLKVLHGSFMYDNAEAYGLVWQDRPPYEVLSTNWLPYGDVIRLKKVEEMVEVLL